jgi:hypothetical protein
VVGIVTTVLWRVNKIGEEIIGPEIEDITGCWIKLSNEELHKLYLSPNITLNKSRRIRWTGRVAHMGYI